MAQEKVAREELLDIKEIKTLSYRPGGGDQVNKLLQSGWILLDTRITQTAERVVSDEEETYIRQTGNVVFVLGKKKVG